MTHGPPFGAGIFTLFYPIAGVGPCVSVPDSQPRRLHKCALFHTDKHKNVARRQNTY